MGLIASLKSFKRRIINGIPMTDVKALIHGGTLSTSFHSSSPGDDSYPFKTDSAIIVGTQEAGGGVAIGYFDVQNPPKALEGEKRIYSRDSNGDIISEFWLKSDGSIKGSNALGFFELLANGDVSINGAIISAAGVITDSGGIVLGTHTHPINSGSSAPGPTGAPS